MIVLLLSANEFLKLLICLLLFIFTPLFAVGK